MFQHYVGKIYCQRVLHTNLMQSCQAVYIGSVDIRAHLQQALHLFLVSGSTGRQEHDPR